MKFIFKTTNVDPHLEIHSLTQVSTVHEVCLMMDPAGSKHVASLHNKRILIANFLCLTAVYYYYTVTCNKMQTIRYNRDFRSFPQFHQASFRSLFN
jgi:hypothetical protein